MTSRQKILIEIVIEEYVKSAEPVSSSQICGKYNIDCSSATIRNDLHILTEAGYLEQFHTSGGRVPTDKAYRFLVDRIMEKSVPTIDEQKKIQAEYLKLKAENRRLAKLTSKLLARLTNIAAISGNLDESEAYETGISSLLKQPEYTNVDRVAEVVDLMEYFDDHLNDVYQGIGKENQKVYIGHETTFHDVKNHSIIISSYNSKNGRKGLLALIGPKRMNYQKNIAIIRGIIDSITKNYLPIVILVNFSYLIIIAK